MELEADVLNVLLAFWNIEKAIFCGDRTQGKIMIFLSNDVGNLI